MLKLEEVRKEKISFVQKRSLSQLKTTFAQLDGWEVENLGVGEDSGKPIYGLSFGDQSKETIFINAAVHGLEWEAVCYALEFAKLISNPQHYLQDTEHMKDIKSMYHFYMIPVA